MISKLPSWIWFFAWMLAFVAGFINVIGFLGFEHQATTHLTGTTSQLGIALVNGSLPEAQHLVLVILSFVVGAAISGAVVKDSVLKIGRRYGLVLLLETLFLIIAIYLLNQNSNSGSYVTGLACGLQNAMVTVYSGTIIRTSHLTGMFTDLGIYLGHFIVGTKIDSRRLKLSLCIISAFLAGGTVGASAFPVLGYQALFIPASITLALALFYGVYSTVKKN